MPHQKGLTMQHTQDPQLTSKPSRNRNALGRGFSLMELLVVLAVLGIVASMAYPSYESYLQRARRSEARTGLMQASLWLERVATATGRYPATLDFPADLQSVPSGAYQILYVAEAKGIGYWLTAQAQGVQQRDRCGNLTLSHTGEKGVRESRLSVQECWNR